MDCFGTYFTHVQTCNVTRVQSATEWTASVHTLHMPKPDVTRVQSATEWTASVHTLHMFASVLNSEIQEGMNNSISLPGKTKCELEMLYKSLQVSTEEVLTPESATCLVKWADECQIENVKAKCVQFLLSQPVNAQGLQLAVKYGLSKRTMQ